MFDFTVEAETRPEEFFDVVSPLDTDGALPCAAASDANGISNRYIWPRAGECVNQYLAIITRRKHGAYFTPAVFCAPPEGKHRRLKSLAVAVRAVWVDIEGTEAKGGYAGREAVLAALERFCVNITVWPTFVVLTGSGGAHAYFVADRNLSIEEWQALANRMVALAEQRGLKIDSPVTTDVSRIMRAPGSVHQKTGVVVMAYRTGPTYSFVDLQAALGTEHGALPTVTSQPYDLSVNADLGLVDEPRKHKPFSMRDAAQHCAAMRMAITDRGAKTPYQPWILALQTAALSIEGEQMGHDISDGHPDYDADLVDQKMASFTGGPPACRTWHRAWGSESPCPVCLYGGVEQ